MPATGRVIVRHSESMRASLYEALGIAPTASDEEVRAALRRLIRKYYAKTRDGQGNVEEALRFINHASRILSDRDRRALYDGELAQSEGVEGVPMAHVGGEATDLAGGTTDLGGSEEHSPAAQREIEAQAQRARAERNLHHPGLTETVATFGRPTSVSIALCALFGAFIAAATVLVMPVDTVEVAKRVLVWLTLTLLTLTVIYGIVHGVAQARRRSAAPTQILMPQTDLAILNWRREKSVFLGTNQPQEDASWIFQLRMAELERAKTGRTSVPQPWNRLAARLFDYAFWGIVLALLSSELRTAGVLHDPLDRWLAHPLLAPMVITGTWIVIESLLMASIGTTPGKWLFGCYLQFSISDAYATREMPAQLARAFRRAFRVWWEGMGCGFPLLAPIVIAIAYERLLQTQETRWDFAQDCLATYAPPGALNIVTGVCGLAAMLWLYGVAWHRPLAESVSSAGTSVVQSLSPMRALLPPSLTGSGAITGVTGGIKGPERSEPNTSSAPLDADVAALQTERHTRIAALKAEGPRMLQAGNFRRAADICGAWADLDLGNADAWRCLGQAQQALGNHKDAISAFRKAKQHDPKDRTLDAAIDRSQKGIVGEFLNRNRK